MTPHEDRLTETQRFLSVAAAVYDMRPQTDLRYANTGKVIRLALRWAGLWDRETSLAWKNCENHPAVDNGRDRDAGQLRASGAIPVGAGAQTAVLESRGGVDFMPRHTFRTITGTWTIELDEVFTTPSDNFDDVLFRDRERVIWGIVLEHGNHPPEVTLAESLTRVRAGSHWSRRVAEFQFPLSGDNLAGHAFLSPKGADHWCLHTRTAGYGVVAELTFLLPSRDDVDWALTAWRSIEYNPSPLAQLWAQSPAPLTDLRRALETGVGLQRAVTQLRKRKYRGEVLRFLGLALEAQQAGTRAAACLGLDYLNDPQAAPALRAMLADSDSLVRMRAADALCRFREPAETLVPVLIEVLRQPEPADLPSGRDRILEPCRYLLMPEAHYHAARILGYLGFAAEPARPALRVALGSQSGIVRAAAAKTLAGLGEPPETYLGPLRQAFHDAEIQSPRERVGVGEALIELGEPAEAVAAVLAELRAERHRRR